MAPSVGGTCRHPPLPNDPAKTNWIEKAGGLPREVDCVARALHHGQGKGVGNAIQMAWGVARNWCKGQGKVKPDTRERACAAVAKLDSMRAKTKAASEELPLITVELSDEDLDALYKEAFLDEEPEQENTLSIVKKLVSKVWPGWTVSQTSDSTVKFTEDDESTSEDDSPTSLKEEGAEEEEESGERQEVTLAYQLPINTTPAVELGNNRWRKHLLPLNKLIKYHDGDTLDFSRPELEAMVSSWKDKAYDTVYAAMGHSREPQKQTGTVADLFIKEEGNPETDGLYADFDLSDDAEKIIQDTGGKIGTSVAYTPNYTRTADDRKFKNALQHVAFVPTPAVPGLQPWEPLVAMSDEQVKFVDLTEAEFSAPERKDGDSVTETRETPKKEEEVKETKELTMEQMQRALELAQDEARQAKDEAKAATERSGATARQLAEQRIDRYLDEQKRTHGVPPFVCELARPLLLAADLSESEEKHTIVQLSESGAEQKELSDGEIVKQLLEANQGKVEFGERGREDLEPPAEDPAQKRHQLIMGRIREKGLKMSDYGEVSREMGMGGELNDA